MSEEKTIKIINKNDNPLQAFGVKISKNSPVEVKESVYEAIKHIQGIEKYVDEQDVKDAAAGLRAELEKANAQIETLKAKIAELEGGTDERTALIEKATALKVKGNLETFKTETLKAKIAEAEQAEE
jgi:hypothetical protein